MSAASPDVDLDVALELAVAAARAPQRLILTHFRDPALRVETKADGSPVSVADRAAEETIRAKLTGHPKLGEFDVLGEEAGESGQGSRLRWLIDPIDGTVSFVHGIPLFGTMVALEDREDGEDGRGLVGVIHLPALGMTYSAARGSGAWRDGDRIAVTPIEDPAETILGIPPPFTFRRAGAEDVLERLIATYPRLRGYWDCYSHALVADGGFGAALDIGLHAWDLVASQVLVEEAGGVVLSRPSKWEGCTDALLGAPAIIDRLAPELGF